MALADIVQLEGWERDTPKRLANEFDLSAGEHGVVEARGKGGGAQLRLRMPPDLVSVGRLPEDVASLFADGTPAVALEDVRPQLVRESKFAVALADALRAGRLVETDPEGRQVDDDRTLLVSPLYQGGRSSLVFGGLAVRPADNALEQPPATSVLVKVGVSVTAGKLSSHEATLDGELVLLGQLAGWPGLPVRVEKRHIAVGALDSAMRKHGVALDPVIAAGRVPAMIVGLGHPRTVEATPRLLSSMIDDTTAPMRRRTRRDLHNALILAEQLATLTRLLHIERRAHRHLSVHAIVVRYEVGILERVLAADLAASVTARSDRDDLLYRDLFDLGTVLVHVLSSVPLTVDRLAFQPPSFPGRALIKRSVEGEGETVYRLLFAVGRYLLEASPAAAPAGQPAPTVRLLDYFLDELAHVRMLHWSRAQGVPERRVPSSTGDGITLPSNMAQRESLARSAADPVATRLVTISHLVSLETLYDWCRRYVTDWWRESISSSADALGTADGAPLAADRCIAILRQGYGRSAAEEMWRYLWNTDDVNPGNLVRVLRNYATHWIREDRYDVPHQLEPATSSEPGMSSGLKHEFDWLRARFTERLASPDDRKLVVDWIDELSHRTAATDDGARGNLRLVKDKRLVSWMNAAALRQLLDSQRRPPTERDIHDVENALRGRNSPETVFWHILLARAWVAAAAQGSVRTTETETGWDKAMRTLLVAAGVAAARQLPFEMAGTLAAAAYLTRSALSTPKLRADLAAQGADEDSVRVQAAECALMAADAYLWLNNQTRHCRSVLEAASLLQGSPFPERLIQAFQLLALARNNRLLDWQPPQIPDESCRAPSADDRFLRYPAIAAEPVRFTTAERALFDELHEAWARIRGRSQTPDDPGTALEHGWFSRYPSSIQSILGPGGPQIELDRSEQLRPEAGAPQGAVRRLLRLAADHYPIVAGDPEPAPGAPRSLGPRILDFGCGAGDEAWDLAKDHQVWAVDSPVWFAAARPEARVTQPGEPRPMFLAFDPADYAQRVLDGQAPSGSPECVDVVLFRCSLCRVSRRGKLLRAAHKLLRPGGFVLATDWIQTRTTDRITWSRLFNTLRFVDLETREGYEHLSRQLDKRDKLERPVQFAEFHSWKWSEVADAGEPMHQFFKRRLDDTKDTLAAETSDLPLSPYARAAHLQAQRDLEVLTAMTTQSGPLGWLFWAARKPLGARAASEG